MSEIGFKHKGSFKPGKQHPNWKGGVTPINNKVRHCARFRLWRKQIFERDDFTCADCGERGGVLHPAHKKSLSNILSDHNIKTLNDAYACNILWDINNGRTLCYKCHGKEHGINFNPKGNRNYRSLVCQQCDQVFKASTKTGKKNPRKFCNRSCYAKYQKLHPNAGVFKRGLYYKSSRNSKRT